ncbi:MAG: ABC transporter ATP-binding protein [Verrucomicrobiota bacterium]
MIVLDHVTKYYDTDEGRRYILRDVSFTFQLGKHYALLGKNGAGKSTLIRLLAGSEKPNSGDIYREGDVSWPLGNIGGFQGSMTGLENSEFVCQVHGLDEDQTQAVIDFVRRFSELESYFFMPVKTYSSGMAGRLRFGLSLAFKFDYYLVDELTSVGDVAFRQKATEEFKKLRERASLIFASHNLNTVVQSCDVALIVYNGRLQYFDDIKEAIEAYKNTFSLQGQKAFEGKKSSNKGNKGKRRNLKRRNKKNSRAQKNEPPF